MTSWHRDIMTSTHHYHTQLTINGHVTRNNYCKCLTDALTLQVWYRSVNLRPREVAKTFSGEKKNFEFWMLNFELSAKPILNCSILNWELSHSHECCVRYLFVQFEWFVFSTSPRISLIECCVRYYSFNSSDSCSVLYHEFHQSHECRVRYYSCNSSNSCSVLHHEFH